MIPFLEKIADRLLEKFPDNMESLAIVFPSKRAVVFFKHYCAKTAATTSHRGKACAEVDRNRFSNRELFLAKYREVALKQGCTSPVRFLHLWWSCTFQPPTDRYLFAQTRSSYRASFLYLDQPR